MDNGSDQQNQEKKEKKLNELLTSSIVDIYVGPESQHWPLHERLLCYHSPFFANVFYAEDKDPSKKSRGTKSYGLPDEDEYPFELLVGWLYSKAIKQPRQEKDLGPILDLYLLAQKLEMEKLSEDVVEVVRDYYHTTSTYPGLRRVQYIYAETDEDNEMREMLVSSIARQLTTSDMIPAHWAKALQRNGQLAVDIIRAIQQWNLEERSIPDFRDGSQIRERAVAGFSAVEGESQDTQVTADTNLGVESVNSDFERSQLKSDDEPEQDQDQEPEPESPLLPPMTPEPRSEPPDKSMSGVLNSPASSRAAAWGNIAKEEFKERPEAAMIVFLWVAFGMWHVVGYFGRESDDR